MRLLGAEKVSDLGPKNVSFPFRWFCFEIADKFLDQLEGR